MTPSSCPLGQPFHTFLSFWEDDIAKTDQAIVEVEAGDYYTEAQVQERFEQGLRQEPAAPLTVHNLWDTLLPIDLGTCSQGAGAQEPVVLETKFRQLDDMLFFGAFYKLQAAANQWLLRHKDAEGRLSADVNRDADGRIRIPYDALYPTIQQTCLDSLNWAEAFLNWEQEPVLNHMDAQLENSAQSHANGPERLTFEQVLGLAQTAGQISAEQATFLKEVRNTVLHANIPTTWTYQQLATAPEYEWLRNLLGFRQKRGRLYAPQYPDTNA